MALEGEKFSIHVIGSVTGQTWAGEFQAIPVLSFRARLNADKMRRELLGGDAQQADQEAAVTASVLAALSVRIVASPKWWQESHGGLDLADPNVIEEVYLKCVEIEGNHKKNLQAEAQKIQQELRK